MVIVFPTTRVAPSWASCIRNEKFNLPLFPGVANRTTITLSGLLAKYSRT